MKEINFTKVSDRSNTFLEALRGIRSNIIFCGDEVKVILLTSVVPDEGKSTVSFELARSFAKMGKKVLLIDSDIRKTVMVSELGIKVEDKSKILGLTHYLTSQASVSDVIYQTSINNLFFISAGPSVPNATELLEKKKFGDLIASAKEKLDYIIIDTAPLTAAIDASVISKYVDGSILVLVPENDSRKLVQKCKKQLEASGARILGVILNKVKMSKNNYYGKYYGSYYGHYGDEK